MAAKRERADEVWLALAAILVGMWGYGVSLFESPGWDYREKPEDALRIVTWNLGGSSGQSGTPLQDLHIEAIASTLRDLHPDLILLQEVETESQLGRLLEQLKKSPDFRRWSGWLADGSGRRVAALGRIRDSDVRSIEGEGERSLLQIHLRSRRWPSIGVLVVHADAYSSQQRNRELGWAADHLRKRMDTEYRVLAGDFNLDLDLDKRRDLFTDDEHEDVKTYNYLCFDLVDTGLGKGPTAEPDRRLDYLMVSQRGWTVDSAGPWRGQRVGDMDHDPVVADMLFE